MQCIYNTITCDLDSRLIAVALQVKPGASKTSHTTPSTPLPKGLKRSTGRKALALSKTYPSACEVRLCGIQKQRWIGMVVQDSKLHGNPSAQKKGFFCTKRLRAWNPKTQKKKTRSVVHVFVRIILEIFAYICHKTRQTVRENSILPYSPCLVRVCWPSWRQ